MSGIEQESPALIIEAWDAAHPRWVELTEFASAQGQANWVQFTAVWHTGSHMLVALTGSHIVGFLRFVTQTIGPDTDCPPVSLHGRVLVEAKVMAFAVHPDAQRCGIGRALQLEAIRCARRLGCYQLRSHSSSHHELNHQLKLSLGFGVHPVVRGDDVRGAYFILPLQSRTDMNVEDI
jgi:GNAT superfamily N-acetyltransferase